VVGRKVSTTPGQLIKVSFEGLDGESKVEVVDDG
jgi:hypothetical protein